MSITDPIYNDETAAREHLEKLLWPEGPVCPHCTTLNDATALKGKSTRPGVYWCNACQKPFSVTVGTIYERSHIPLHKWLLATHLLTASKKGVSAHQLMRMLDLGSYRSAWFMAHRIRAAMAPVPGSEPPLGGDGKVVEADEAYIGKKAGPKGRKRPSARGYAHKQTVLSLVERGGKIRSFKLRDNSRKEIEAAIRANVSPDSLLHTDGAGAYKGLAATAGHESVDHNTTYVRKSEIADTNVHTNTLEGFFSVFKRGMIGTYQHCGEQHLQRYLGEFDFRANTRQALGFNDDDRAAMAVKGIAGKRLTYRRPNAA